MNTHRMFGILWLVNACVFFVAGVVLPNWPFYLVSAAFGVGGLYLVGYPYD